LVARSTIALAERQADPDLPEVVAKTIIGVIARAQERYEVAVIDVKQMNSHLHLLSFFEDGQQMSRFMRYVNSNLARKIGRLVGWRGPLWERRHSQLRGTWLDLSGQFRAAQRAESTSTRKFVKKHTLELDKLPCWKHLDAEDYRKRVRALVDLITEETATMHALALALADSEPLGVRELKKLRPIHCARPSQTALPSLSSTRRVVRSAGSSERVGGGSSSPSSPPRSV
jgi:REP element-mobilizing transposase RayT